VNRASALLALLLLPASLAGCAKPIAPIDPASRAAADPALVAKGAALAAVGNCRGCHTPRGGQPFAGGEPMSSPFGTIYSTNITPDPDTGIGRWSEEAFRRALRKGVDDEGAHLYPAFPYDRFTRATDDDIHALYAYVMSQQPVRNTPPKNELVFPFNLRFVNAVWQWLFLREGAQPADVTKGTVLARGEYLVEGLGHCASCHTPRNFMQAEKRGHAYEGGEGEGWHAYAINTGNAAPIPWDAAALAAYLRTGFHPQHGVSRGTMGLVTGELAHAQESDVNAMAAYVASLMGPPAEARKQRAQALLKDPLAIGPDAAASGSAIVYQGACLPCHDGARALPFGGIPLSLSLGLTGESPRNLVNVILHGLDPAPGETSPMMPGYAGALNDEEVESLVQWLRENLTDKPRWDGVAKLIHESRAMKANMLLFPPGGAGADPTTANPARP